jgi:hypothetical protein
MGKNRLRRTSSVRIAKSGKLERDLAIPFEPYLSARLQGDAN